MANSRDPKRLREVWEGWHTISIPIRQDYQRFAELSNKGAVELGFPDTGAMWRSKYDMPPDAFAAEMDRLWEQVRPLYLSLHAYMRMRLRERYGDLVPEKGPIPAYLLGNIWAQSWENLYPDVAPTTGAKAYDLTKILAARKTSAVDMVKFGERFFVSLGQAPLPQTFYERSLLMKPRDREVVCHASAWAHRSRRRCADQDVHRPHRRRLHRDPPRTGSQLLPARLQGPAGAVPRQRQRRLSRSARRHDRALGDAGVSGQGGADRHRRPTRRATPGCCCSRRWRRSPSCRSACSWTSGDGRCSRDR